MPGRRNMRFQLPFARKLVLNQWLLSLFGVGRLEQLAEFAGSLFKGSYIRAMLEAVGR